MPPVTPTTILPSPSPSHPRRCDPRRPTKSERRFTPGLETPRILAPSTAGNALSEACRLLPCTGRESRGILHGATAPGASGQRRFWAGRLGYEEAFSVGLRCCARERARGLPDLRQRRPPRLRR